MHENVAALNVVHYIPSRDYNSRSKLLVIISKTTDFHFLEFVRLTIKKGLFLGIYAIKRSTF